MALAHRRHEELELEARVENEAGQLDEKFYLELFHPQRPAAKKKART